MAEITCLWKKARNVILGRNSSLVFPSKDTPKRPYPALDTEKRMCRCQVPQYM